ncbi:MAG: site-2 protease family protein [Acidobacteriota bacterium]
MGRRFHIATIFGIAIRLDLSWLLIVVLLTWSLAFAFSRDYPYLGWASRIAMGLTASVLLFVSVLAHELSHAVVALRHGISIRGITLFIFGGAAEMADEPPDAAAELKVALAGPAMSLALALGFLGLFSLGLGWVPPPLLGVVKYLALMNGILVAFNLVPGFPLDGGRVLRAALWGIWGNLRLATRTASAVGSGFGALIMLCGFLYVFPIGNVVGGIWYVFIGLFLRNAARVSYQQVLLRDWLRGLKARDLMQTGVVSISPETPLKEIVDELLLTTGNSEFPVVSGSRFVGMVGLKEIRSVPRRQWPYKTAGEVMKGDSERLSVSSDESAARLLSMVTHEEVVIPVLDEETLVGVVTGREMMRRLRLQIQLSRG